MVFRDVLMAAVFVVLAALLTRCLLVEAGRVSYSENLRIIQGYLVKTGEGKQLRRYLSSHIMRK